MAMYQRELHNRIGPWLLALTLCIGAFFTPEKASSEEQMHPLTHPGNRYARENVASDVLAHWVGDVGVQFVSITEPEIQKTVLSEILALGAAARVDVQILGFPNAMFDGNTLDPKAEIVLLSFEAEHEASLVAGWDSARQLGDVDFASASPAVAEILASGLVQQADGCLAKWKASDSNVIQGMVIAASNAIGAPGRSSCFKTFIPAAFGISPVVSLFDMGALGGGLSGGQAATFADRSELILELSAAAYCRNALGDFGGMCPFRLINSIFSHHADLAKLEAN